MSNYSILGNCCSGKLWKNYNLIFGKQKHICCYINTTFMFCLRGKKSMVKSSHVDIHYIWGFVVGGGRFILSSQIRMGFNLEDSQLHRIKYFLLSISLCLRPNCLENFIYIEQSLFNLFSL